MSTADVSTALERARRILYEQKILDAPTTAVAQAYATLALAEEESRRTGLLEEDIERRQAWAVAEAEKSQRALDAVIGTMVVEVLDSDGVEVDRREFGLGQLVSVELPDGARAVRVRPGDGR